MTIFKGFSKNEECCKVLTDKNEPVTPPNNDHRKKTDRWFLFIFISCMVLLLPLLIYTWIHSYINRYNGIDGCGNICGQKNVENDEWGCSGQDMTLKPFKKYSECVTEEELVQYYYSYDDGKESIFTNVNHLTASLILAYFIPFGSSLILALLIRYLTAFTVWIILITFWLLIPASFLFVWMHSFYLPTVGIISIVMASIVFGVCVPKMGTLGLVITLLKEASKTVFSIHNVIFNAAMISIVSLMIVIASSVICFCLKTSGVLIEQYMYYTTDAYMEALTLIIIFWTIRFVIGIGHMTTSETIANKYFLRYQETCTGNIAVKYHSGTVAMTSLLSTIMFIPRVILITLAQVPLLTYMMNYCLRYMDGYFSKNVYIMTAMNGTSFRESGKKAMELFRSSVGNTENVNFFGNIVLMLTQLVVTIPCFALLIIYYYEVFNSTLIGGLVFLTLYISTESVFGPFKVAMSTIFFCICQDNLHKKGTNEPHTISMTDYLTTSHNLFEEKVKEKWLSRKLEHLEKL